MFMPQPGHSLHPLSATAPPVAPSSCTAPGKCEKALNFPGCNPLVTTKVQYSRWQDYCTLICDPGNHNWPRRQARKEEP